MEPSTWSSFSLFHHVGNHLLHQHLNICRGNDTQCYSSSLSSSFVFFPTVMKALPCLWHIHIHLLAHRLAFCGNNRIALWNYPWPVCSQSSKPRPCPIKATLSMWCELINIIDATKAARHRVLLQAKGNQQENRFSSLQIKWLLALPQAQWELWQFYFWAVCDLLLDLLLHIHFCNLVILCGVH